MRAKLFVPAGTSFHCNGGEMSRPSQVNLIGICSPSPKEGLRSFMARVRWLPQPFTQMTGASRAMPRQLRVLGRPDHHFGILVGARRLLRDTARPAHPVTHG